jgi:hypothetical protein
LVGTIIVTNLGQETLFGDTQSLQQKSFSELLNSPRQGNEWWYIKTRDIETLQLLVNTSSEFVR